MRPFDGASDWLFLYLVMDFFLDDIIFADLIFFFLRYMSNNRTEKIDELAEIFKALSNPHRLKIFLRLATCCRPGTVGYIDENSTAFVGELGDELGVVKSTVSHHIKELKRVGIIRTERKGQKIACWVDPKMVDDLKKFFSF